MEQEFQVNFYDVDMNAQVKQLIQVRKGESVEEALSQNLVPVYLHDSVLCCLADISLQEEDEQRENLVKGKAVLYRYTCNSCIIDSFLTIF